MLYLISEIVVCLLVALVAGFLIGWATARRGRGFKAEVAKGRLQKSSESTREELAYATTRLKQLEAELERLRREQVQWTSQWQEYQIALTERDSQLLRLQGHVEAYETRLRELSDSGSGQATSLRILGEQLSSLLERLPVSPARHSASSGPDHAADRPAQAVLDLNGGETPADQDDLKKIHGIGPAIERLLNGMGITKYAQIASWSDEEIDRIQSRLMGFSNRIRRDNWVQNAKREHLAKYGEQL